VEVVGATNEVHLRNVKVGEQFGSQWIIEEGLNAGERVIVEGTQKAKEGTVVNPQPFGSEGTNAVKGAETETNSATHTNDSK
jgi:membrane fusion protein (multidrug efflux system)